MKNFIAVLVASFLLLSSSLGFAGMQENRTYWPKENRPMVSYDAPNYAFPDQSTHQGLPEVIPCVFIQDKLRCQWLTYSDNIYVYDQRGEPVRIYNEIHVVCRRGVCRSSFGDSGWYPEDISVEVNFWYYVKESVDGKMIAIRRDIAGDFTYYHAGMTLYNWYIDMGVPENLAYRLLDWLYEGGWPQIEKDQERICSGNYEHSSYCGE